MKGLKKKYSSKAKKKEVEKPDSVSQEIWDDYLEVRKAKKAGVFTSTALRMIIEDAGKVLISLEDALKHCIKKAWIGFDADWYTNSKQGFGSAGKGRLGASQQAPKFIANHSEDGML